MFERDKKTDTGDEVTSLIDADMRITGSVVSSGDIILAGGVEGEIKCRNLLIEDQALLTGNVNADEAIVAGQVNGDAAGDFEGPCQMRSSLTCSPAPASATAPWSCSR